MAHGSFTWRCVGLETVSEPRPVRDLSGQYECAWQFLCRTLSTKNTDIIMRHGVYFTTVTDLHKAQKQRLKYIRSFFFGGYMWIWVLEEKQLAELHGHHSSIFLTSFNCVVKGLVASRDQTYSQCKLLYLFSWRIADETWYKNVLDVGSSISPKNIRNTSLREKLRAFWKK